MLRVLSSRQAVTRPTASAVFEYISERSRCAQLEPLDLGPAIVAIFEPQNAVTVLGVNVCVSGGVIHCGWWCVFVRACEYGMGAREL